jgi:AcrR family transcriptional regulator
MDRRVRRTRQLLREALTELIVEKDYALITVRDILDRADVGRSTFYAHFRDKDDLLLAGMSDVRDVIDSETRQVTEAGDGPAELLGPSLVVFSHVERYRSTWRPLARRGGLSPPMGLLGEHAEMLLRVHLRTWFPHCDPRDARFEAAVRATTGALVGLVSAWVAGDVEYSAAEAHATFCRLAVPGLLDLLGPA